MLNINLQDFFDVHKLSVAADELVNRIRKTLDEGGVVCFKEADIIAHEFTTTAQFNEWYQCLYPNT